MVNPLISIIIPVYNAENSLVRCVDSILAQSFADFELLLIDDGSIDQSGVICDEYANSDERVKVFHQNNEGVSSARNVGINNANGLFIHFVDADDWIEENTYSSIFSQQHMADITYISNVEHLEDGTIVTYSMPCIFCDSREEIEKAILYLKDNNSKYPFFGFTWNKIFRTDIIKNNNISFIRELALYEDEIFTDNYCRYIKSINILSMPLYHYQRTSSGLTGRPRNAKHLLILVDNIIMLKNVYKLKPLVCYEQKRALDFLKQAMVHDLEQRYFHQEKFYLKRIIDMDSSIDIGKKFRFMNSCAGFVCRILFKVYYILAKTFI